MLLILWLSACDHEARRELTAPTDDSTKLFCNEEIQEIALSGPFDSEALAGQSEPIDTANNELISRSAPITVYNLSPYQGCPGVTKYSFAVRDYRTLPVIAVKLFSPTGVTHYVDMKRSGDYQVLTAVLSTPGRWYWRYVYSSTKQPLGSTSSYYKDNTAVQLSASGTSKLHWPFSGSGWRITCGHGCGLHTDSNGEYYATDWTTGNRTTTEDAPFYSPLDGIVVNIDYSASTYGNYVDIEQSVGTMKGKFRIAHLNEVSVYEGQAVIGGKTLVGRIGDTGGTSTAPHAHCSLFDITSGQNSIPFTFTASCQ